MEKLEDKLFSAVSFGNVHHVEDLLQQGANMNVVCAQGRTSLGLAAELGNTAVLKKLLDFSNTPALYCREREHRKRRIKKWKKDHESAATPPSAHSQTSNAQSGTSKQGYFVVVHGDDKTPASAATPTTTPTTTPTPTTTTATTATPTATAMAKPTPEQSSADVRTPEGMDALEWDAEMPSGSPERTTADEERYERLYRWYASILDRTSSLIQSPQNRDVNHQDTYSRCALHYAAEYGHEDAVLLLISAGCRVDIGDKENRTPLHLAASRGHSIVAVHLLESGAEVNRKTTDRTSALHIAASRGYSNFARVLLEHGANVDALDASDRTPLLLAVLRHRAHMVRLLLDHGAKVNIEEIHGYTPLCEAVWQKSVPMVKLLLDAGAKVTQSHYLLHYAVVHRQIDMAELLLHAGCISNLRDDNGDTPLIVAARTGNCELTELLLKSGANVNYSNSLTGSTPLHESVEYIRECDFHAFKGMVKVLRSYGARLSADTFTGGDSALFRAILLHKYQAAELLIKLGTDVNKCDVKICGADLVTLARKRNHFGLVRLLVFAGFNLSNTCPKIWPASNPNDLDLDSVDDWLKYMKYNPMNLAELCRITIRKKMGEQISEFVSASCLPNTLKNFIMLENVTM